MLEEKKSGWNASLFSFYVPDFLHLRGPVFTFGRQITFKLRSDPFGFKRLHAGGWIDVAWEFEEGFKLGAKVVGSPREPEMGRDFTDNNCKKSAACIQCLRMNPQMISTPRTGSGAEPATLSENPTQLFYEEDKFLQIQL